MQTKHDSPSRRIEFAGEVAEDAETLLVADAIAAVDNATKNKRSRTRPTELPSARRRTQNAQLD